MTRSRRAGLSRDEARRQPLYARMLGLQYLAPSGFLCFVFLEGAIALGILLALAELVSWWGVLVLPVTVAAMVKLNDVVAGALTRASRAGAGTRGPVPARSAGRGTAVGDDAAVLGSSDDGIGVGGSGVYTSSRVGEAASRQAASAASEAPAQRSSRRWSPGARTVKLPPSVIAQAARDAGHDQAPYGRRAAGSPPETRVPDQAEPEPGRAAPKAAWERGSVTERSADDPFSPARSPYPSGPGRFSFEADLLAPDSALTTPAPDHFIPAADQVSGAPTAAGPMPADIPPTSESFAPTSDGFSGPYSLPLSYDTSVPGIGPSGAGEPHPLAERNRWTTRDDDYLPPLADGPHGGADAAEPGMFPAMDPPQLPTGPAPINGPRATPRWSGYLDEQEQRTHQSAARRYE